MTIEKKISFHQLSDNTLSCGVDSLYFLYLTHQYYLSHISNQYVENEGMEEIEKLSLYFSDSIFISDNYFIPYLSNENYFHLELKLLTLSIHLLPCRALMLRNSFFVPPSSILSASTKLPECIIYQKKRKTYQESFFFNSNFNDALYDPSIQFLQKWIILFLKNNLPTHFNIPISFIIHSMVEKISWLRNSPTKTGILFLLRNGISEHLPLLITQLDPRFRNCKMQRMSIIAPSFVRL